MQQKDQGAFDTSTTATGLSHYVMCLVYKVYHNLLTVSYTKMLSAVHQSYGLPG